MKLSEKIALAICVGILIFMLASIARAEGAHCATHDQISKGLSEQYKESNIGMGVVSATAMIEIYISKAVTFTVVRTQTDGMSCIVYAGNDWQSMKPDNGPSY